MGYQVIKQPDGKLAVFSTGGDCWVFRDGEPGEVVEWFAEKAARDARRSAQETVDAVLAGKPREIYCQFAMTFEEANAMSGEHGGVVLPGGSASR